VKRARRVGFSPWRGRRAAAQCGATGVWRKKVLGRLVRGRKMRAAWAGWAGQRPRHNAGLAVVAQKEGRGVGRPGWKERRAADGANTEPGQNSKEILFEFQFIFRIWENFGNLHKEI
jgi:hypothetical protein